MTLHSARTRDLSFGLAVVFCCCISPRQAHCQETLTSDDFFSVVLTDMDSLLAIPLQNRTFRPSWLEEIDLRTESDEFDPGRQRYLIRLSPSTGKIRKVLATLHQHYQTNVVLEQDQWRGSFIKAAYQDWLDLYFHSSTLSLEQMLLTVLQDQQLVTQKLAMVSEASIKDVIGIQRDIDELKIEIFGESQQLELLFPFPGQLDFSDLIGLEAIRQKIQVASIAGSVPENQRLALKKQILDAEIQLEQAEKNRFFDFLQFEYRGPKKDFLKENISVGLGINIPIASDKRLKMEALSMEKEITEQKSLVENELTGQEIKDQLQTLNLLFRKLDYARSLYDASARQGFSLAEKSSPESPSTPLWQLYQKALVLKNKLDLLDIEKDIYQEYIQLLELNKILFQEPFVNQLKK